VGVDARSNLVLLPAVTRRKPKTPVANHCGSFF